MNTFCHYFKLMELLDKYEEDYDYDEDQYTPLMHLKRTVGKLENTTLTKICKNLSFIHCLSYYSGMEEDNESLRYLISERGILFDISTFCELISSGINMEAIVYIYENCKFELTMSNFKQYFINCVVSEIDSEPLEYFIKLYMENYINIIKNIYLDIPSLYSENTYDHYCEKYFLEKQELLVKLHRFQFEQEKNSLIQS